MLWALRWHSPPLYFLPSFLPSGFLCWCPPLFKDWLILTKRKSICVFEFDWVEIYFKNNQASLQFAIDRSMYAIIYDSGLLDLLGGTNPTEFRNHRPNMQRYCSQTTHLELLNGWRNARSCSRNTTIDTDRKQAKTHLH